MTNKYENFIVASTEVLKYLNHKIIKAEGTVDGTLRLFFEDGLAMAIYDDNKNYESYQIKRGDEWAIVV